MKYFVDTARQKCRLKVSVLKWNDWSLQMGSNHGTILLIELGEADASIIARRIRYHKYGVTHCETFNQAQMLLRRDMAQYCALITDLNRKTGDDGVMFIRGLKRRCSTHLPILTHSSVDRISGISLLDFMPTLCTTDGRVDFLQRPGEIGNAAFIDSFMSTLQA